MKDDVCRKDLSVMRSWATNALLLPVLLCLLFVCFVRAESETPIPEHIPAEVAAKLFQRLPPDWQTIVTRYRIFDAYDFRYLYARSSPEHFEQYWTDANLRYRILRLVESEPGGQEFVLDHLSDPALAAGHQTQYLYYWLGADEEDVWVHNSRVLSVLEQATVTEPDPQSAKAAFRALQMLQARRMRDSVELRLKSSRFISYPWGTHANEEEKQQWLSEDRSLYYLLDGVNLPAFLREPPPVFTVESKPSVRAVIIGDYGTMDQGHENQKKVADAMIAYNKQKAFDFGLTVGDNFYFKMKSPHDALWKVDFEDLYGPLNITFYPAFGNHDWDEQMPAIELLHSEASRHWQFPAPYYTYVAGPIQFFVINTGAIEDLALNSAQLAWLEGELAKSKAAWKVVYGHYPVKDNEQGVNWKVYNRLVPVLRGHADIYLAGHMHNFEHLRPEAGVNLFVAGGSGQAASGGSQFNSEALFVSKGGVNGFAVLDADSHSANIRFVDTQGKEMYQTTLRK